MYYFSILFRSKLISIGLLPTDRICAAPLTLMSFLPSPLPFRGVPGVSLTLICGTAHNTVVSVACPLTKAMQTEEEKVYHKAVYVGFYGSLFHQGTSAVYPKGIYKDLLIYIVITTYFCVA